MADEAILRNKLNAVAFDVTVDDAVGIEKGTIMKLSAGDRVGAPCTADDDIFLGITVAEKIANSGRSHVSVIRGPSIWDIKDSNAGITLGDIVMIKGTNLIATLDEAGAMSHAQIVGIALEDIGASATGQILVF